MRVLGPVHGVLVADESQGGAGLWATLIQSAAVLLDHLRRVGRRYDARRSQAVSVDLPGGRMLTDHLVHARLRRGRLIRLVVAEAAIADQVNDHVLPELHAVLEGQAADEHHSFRVVPVDMENRRLKHFRHIRAVHGRTRIARIGNREADLVVDDDVQRATGVEGPRLRQLQGFRDDTLTGKCGVAMNLDGQHPGTGRVAAPFLAGPHRAFDHRVDDFEMRWIEGQRHMHVAGRRLQVRGEALVVLHVAGALLVGHVVLAFELGEDVRRRLAQQIHQHIEAAAVGHADDHFLHAAAAPDCWMTSSSNGISDSPPSSEKRRWPTYLVCR